MIIIIITTIIVIIIIITKISITRDNLTSFCWSTTRLQTYTTKSIEHGMGGKGGGWRFLKHTKYQLNNSNQNVIYNHIQNMHKKTAYDFAGTFAAHFKLKHVLTCSCIFCA